MRFYFSLKSKRAKWKDMEMRGKKRRQNGKWMGVDRQTHRQKNSDKVFSYSASFLEIK